MSEAYTRQTLHDYALDHIYAVAESMGYRIAEINLAREHRTGPDIYVVNPVNGKGVVVESELGHNITSKSYEKWKKRGRDYILQNKATALIVLTETPRRAWKHFPKNLRKSKSFFVVGGSVFKDVIPSLLVKILQ
jgi:hypothetical protein